MARNEAVLLTIWWRYYSQFFQPEDMYILDPESTDGYLRSRVCPVPVTHQVVDWGWHRDMLQEKQLSLMERYDVVLCIDVDEIVALSRVPSTWVTI